MVLHVMQWSILPDKKEAYMAWAKGAVARALSVPGVTEVRGYRPVTGSAEVVITYEFADLAAWEAWYSNPTVQTVQAELQSFTIDLSTELWGASPVIPVPIRPGAGK